MKPGGESDSGWLLPIRSLFLRQLRRSESGSAAIEFAFIAPVFLVVLFAIIEMGRLFWLQSSLQLAVEDVARVVMAEYTRSHWADPSKTDATLVADIKSSAEAQLPTGILGWSFTGVSYTVTIDASGDPNYVQLEADYDFSFLLPFVTMPAMSLYAVTKVPMIKFDH